LYFISGKIKMKKYINIFCLSVILIWPSFAVFPQTTYAPDEILRPDPQIIIGKLDNGLTYYIRENKKPEKRAELRLAVKAGSVLEDDDQQGLAHFDEHMAFNGTKDFPKQALIDFLEKTGVRFGPELNAYTSFDETVYMLQVPTDSQEILTKGLQILEQWAHEMTFDDKEIDKERGVVIEEWRLRRGADYRVAMKHIPYELYKSHYAERITIGKKEILESCPHDALRRFYRDWYRPDLMAVLAVGDFDGRKIEKLIKKIFSQMKNPKSERKLVKYPVPDHDKMLVSIVTDPELTGSSAEIMFKREGRESRTASEYRGDIISNLYISMMNERLREMLQQPEPPFIDGYVTNGRFFGGKYVFMAGADLKENAILIGFEAVLREVFRVKQHGFTASELERNKKELLSRMERYYRERDKTESRSFIDEYTRNFLVGETIPGIKAELNLYRQFLPGISVEDINKLTGKFITAGNRVVTLSLPLKEGIEVPSEADIVELLDKTGKEELEPYTDKTVSEPLISLLPPRGKIIREKKTESLGVTEWALSNGARVVLKPTDFKNDEILFSAYADGGTSLAADSDYISAIFATPLINQSGAGVFDYNSLEKKLAGKNLYINPSINQTAEGFTGSTSPKDMETLFQLVYLYSTSPRKDTVAFSSLIARYKAMLQNRSASPEAAYGDTIRVTLANYHFRSRPFSISMVDEANLDKAVNFYRNRFADFSNFTFFFIGSFDMDSIKPLVEQYLASLPSLKRNETWRDVGIEPPKGIITKEVDRGIEPKSLVNITFTGPFEWSQQNRYDFNSMIDALNIRLREVLREDKGGTYGVRISGYHARYPRQEYTITISWGCNPERVDELVRETFKQIDSLKTKPFDPVYVEKVRETQRRTYEVNLKKNSFWLGNLQAYYTNRENPEMILNYPSLVDHLNAAGLQEAVKKYFNTDNYVKIVLLPEKEKRTNTGRIKP
jgi:zinc protease